MADENRLPMDEFVNKLVSDPSNPPDTLLLSGFLGSSSEEGYTRLYFDPQLSAYVEVPTAAILHTQPLPKEQSPLGGSYVWVQRDAELIHGKVGAQPRPKAKFFEGPIMQEFMQGRQGFAQPGAAPGGIGQGQAPMAPQSQFGPCPSQLIIACQPTLLCPSQQINCQSVATPCLSQQLPCITQPQVCQTIQPPCPSIFAPCPSQQLPCPSQQFPCPSQQLPCLSQQIPCQSLLRPCLSQQIPCPSQQIPCPTFQCPSVQQICPSQQVICPSIPPGCPTGFVCPSQGSGCPSAVDGCPSQFCPTIGGCVSQQCGPLGPQGFGQMQPQMQPQQHQFFPSRFGPQCPFPSQQQVVCPSLVDGCPSQQIICQSAVTCPSQAVICQSVICPSQQVICQSVVCPSQQVICQSVVCPSQQVICQSAVTCPSQAVICQSVACPSQALICQSLVCPSQVVVCQSLACPSQAVVCQSLACPSQAVLCQSLACPSFAGCPSLACGPGGGGQFGAQAQGFGQFFPSQGGQQCPIPSLWYGQCRSWADGCPSQFCPQV